MYTIYKTMRLFYSFQPHAIREGSTWDNLLSAPKMEKTYADLESAKEVLEANPSLLFRLKNDPQNSQCLIEYTLKEVNDKGHEKILGFSKLDIGVYSMTEQGYQKIASGFNNWLQAETYARENIEGEYWIA